MAKRTSKGKGNNSTTKVRATRTEAEMLKQMGTNKSSRRLINLLGDLNFVKTHPGTIVEDCTDLLGEIFDMNLAGNMTSEEINMMSSIIYDTVKGYRSTHNDLDDFEGLMEKFTLIAAERDGFLDLGREVEGVLKSTYFEAISDEDAIHLVCYICVQACIASVFGDTVSVAASGSTKEEPTEPEKPSKPNQLDGMNLDRFKTNTTPEVVDVEVIEPDRLTKDQVFVIIDKISESAAEEMLGEMKVLINNTFKNNISDDTLMSIIISAVSSTISSNFNIDEIVNGKDIELLTDGIESFSQQIVEKIMADVAMELSGINAEINSAASGSTKDEPNEPDAAKCEIVPISSLNSAQKECIDELLKDDLVCCEIVEYIEYKLNLASQTQKLQKLAKGVVREFLEDTVGKEYPDGDIPTVAFMVTAVDHNAGDLAAKVMKLVAA